MEKTATPAGEYVLSLSDLLRERDSIAERLIELNGLINYVQKHGKKVSNSPMTDITDNMLSFGGQETNMTLKEAVIKVLTDSRESLQTDRIMEKLKGIGVKTTIASLKSTLYMLKKTGKIRSAGRGKSRIA